MRATTLVVVAALSLASAWAVPANAAPMIPNPAANAPSNIIQVWGGCGWGFRPTYWGGCVPNGYYRPHWRYGYHRRFWRRGYWRGGYWRRRW